MGWLLAIAAFFVLSQQAGTAATPAPSAAGIAGASAPGSAITPAENGVTPSADHGGPGVNWAGVGINSTLNAGLPAALGALHAGAGAVGALGSAAIGAGIGAAVVLAGMGINNLLTCGTIGHEGCTKRADTEVDKEGEILARRVIWAVESGQMGASQAKGMLATIWANMQKSWQEPYRSGETTSFDGFCGQGADPGQPPFYARIGAPANSQAATYLCGSNPQSRDWMWNTAFPQLIDQLAAKTGKA